MVKNGIDAAVVKTNYTTWGFSLSSIVAALAQIDWAALVMGCLGFVSLIANIAFMVAKHKKENMEHEARMILLNRQIAETEIAERSEHNEHEKADIHA